jgi:hypothetical protein
MGVRRLIAFADLPRSFATRSSATCRSAPPDRRRHSKGAPGLRVALVASGLNMPCVFRIAPNGDVFLAETGAGGVRVFRATRASGGPGRGEIFAEGMQRPYGTTFYPSGQDPPPGSAGPFRIAAPR